MLGADDGANIEQGCAVECFRTDCLYDLMRLLARNDHSADQYEVGVKKAYIFRDNGLGRSTSYRKLLAAMKLKKLFDCAVCPVQSARGSTLACDV